jgi:hypothetical protein
MKALGFRIEGSKLKIWVRASKLTDRFWLADLLDFRLSKSEFVHNY